MKNGENPANPISRIENCEFIPRRLSAKPRAGPSDTLDQIIEKAHRIVESELDPKHKRLFRKSAQSLK